MRSEKDENTFYEIKGDITLGDKAPDGFQWRPHVVWFGERVPNILEAREIMSMADIFILVGTSLQVYPASGLIDYLPLHADKYIIDKKPPYVPEYHNFHVIKESATDGMRALQKILAS